MAEAKSPPPAVQVPEREPVFERSNAKVLARLARTGPVNFGLDVVPCLQLIAALQRALRHQDENDRTAVFAASLAWALRDELVEREPDIAATIDAGWAEIPKDRRN